MRCRWEGLIGSLVSWTRKLIVHQDAYGKYIAPSDRKDPKKATFTEKSEPTDAVLRAHFAGDAVARHAIHRRKRPYSEGRSR